MRAGERREKGIKRDRHGREEREGRERETPHLLPIQEGGMQNFSTHSSLHFKGTIKKNFSAVFFKVSYLSSLNA